MSNSVIIHFTCVTRYFPLVSESKMTGCAHRSGKDDHFGEKVRLHYVIEKVK